MKTTDSTTQAVTRLLQMSAQKIWPYVKTSVEKPATAGDLCKKGVFLNFSDVPGDLCDVTIQYAEFKCTLPCEQIFATLAKFEAIAGGKKEVFTPKKYDDKPAILTALVNIPGEVAKFGELFTKPRVSDDRHDEEANRFFISLAKEYVCAQNSTYGMGVITMGIELEDVTSDEKGACYLDENRGLRLKDFSLLKKIAGRTITITATNDIRANIELDGVTYLDCLELYSVPAVEKVFSPVSLVNSVTLDEVCKRDIINACKCADKNKDVDDVLLQFNSFSDSVYLNYLDGENNCLGDKTIKLNRPATATMYVRMRPKQLQAIIQLSDGVLYNAGKGNIYTASEDNGHGRASMLLGWLKFSDEHGRNEFTPDDNKIGWWMNLRRVAHPLNDGDKQSIICSWKALYNMIVTAGNIVDDENGRGYIEYTDEDGDSDVTAVCFTRFGASVTAETI